MTMDDQQKNRIKTALGYLKQCAETLSQQMDSSTQSIPHLATLEEFIEFIHQVDEWSVRLTPYKLREIILPVLIHMHRFLQDLDTKELEKVPIQKLLAQALVQLGPETVVSQDRMNVCVYIPSEIASFWTPAGLIESLQGMGIKYGFEKERIKNLFAEKQFDRLVRIAHGKDPASGSNATLKNCLNIRSFDAYQNATSLPVFTWVRKGEKVFKKEPPGKGEKGRNVYGEEITAPKGSDMALPKIQHCITAQDRLSLQVKVDGCAYYDHNHSLQIVPAKYVEGHIEAQQGELHFETSVLIEGDVQDKSIVRSQKDIAIRGVIGDATLHAGGSVLCQESVIGTGQAQIYAGCDFYAKKVQQAQIEAERFLRVDGAMNQTQAKARRIYVEGKEGQIAGGEIRALFDIYAHVLGSEDGTRTKVIIENHSNHLQAEIDRLAYAIREKKAQQKKLSDQQKTSPHDSSKQIKFQQMLDQINQDLQKLQNTLDQYQQDLSNKENLPPLVCVYHAIYPNTVIQIYGKTMNINKKLGPAIIMFMDGQLIVEPYQESLLHREKEIKA